MWKLVLEINAVERSMNGARGAERELYIVFYMEGYR